MKIAPSSHPLPLPTLCNLHFALQFPRRCSPDHSIELFARRWPIAPTRLKKVTIIHHPERQFWVIPHPPVAPAFAWPSILALIRSANLRLLAHGDTDEWLPVKKERLAAYPSCAFTLIHTKL